MSLMDPESIYSSEQIDKKNETQIWRELILPFCGAKKASHGFWGDVIII